MKTKDAAWIASQRLKLEYLQWECEKEEIDPLFDDKICRILDFIKNNRTGIDDRQTLYLTIQKMYGFITTYQNFKLSTFLSLDGRGN